MKLFEIPQEFPKENLHELILQLPAIQIEDPEKSKLYAEYHHNMFPFDRKAHKVNFYSYEGREFAYSHLTGKNDYRDSIAFIKDGTKFDKSVAITNSYEPTAFTGRPNEFFKTANDYVSVAYHPDILFETNEKYQKIIQFGEKYTTDKSTKILGLKLKNIFPDPQLIYFELNDPFNITAMEFEFRTKEILYFFTPEMFKDIIGFLFD